MIIVMAVTVGILYATGTFLLLQRTLTRIVMGLALMGHGANLLLLLAGGRAGRAPIIGGDEAGHGIDAGGSLAAEGATSFADPLPQAMALTAIVITFGITAFLLALAYRSWTLTHDDEVEDDVEDRRLATMRRQLDGRPEADGETST